MASIVEYDLGPLRTAQTVVVIGGGPAGASCAIALRNHALRQRVSLHVMLFEMKDFSCERNVCVGVLSPPFRRLLGSLDLSLPDGIVQRRISGYTLHSKRQSVFLEERTDGDEQTVVVDRADFDNFLLGSAMRAGVAVVRDEVADLQIAPANVLVLSKRGLRVEADVVVGAFGLDDEMLSLFERRLPAFRRPPVVKSILADVHLPEKVVAERFNGTIHAMLIDQLPRVEFGALTPKRDHVTVNIAGENIGDDDLDAFLRLPWGRKLVPEAGNGDVRYHAAFPSGPARGFYCDRAITIGDASGMLRPLKGKGISTGIITGVEAARTMLEVGISKKAFDEFYRRCQTITREFSYGIFLRHLYRLSEKLDALDAVVGLARREPMLYRAFYDMVSGEGSYKEIVLRSARPDLMGKILLAIVRYRLVGR